MLVKIKVYPDAKKSVIIRKGQDHLWVYTRAKARQGQANREVKQMLCAYFHIHAARLRLVKGGKRQSKIFEINN